MPIALEHHQTENLCWGYCWTIGDQDLLARLVAKVLIGRERHVAKILGGATGGNIQYNQNAVNDAIEKLTVPPGTDPWHRDGLVFQIFSWIATNKVADANTIVRSPHLIPAHKGFDGLQVDVDGATGYVVSVVISEDKATTSPRNTIREKVWPEFDTLNSGQREGELMQEVTSLLLTRPDLAHDIDQAIEVLIWQRVRKFRVSITCEASHLSERGIKRLFKDYDGCVPGVDVALRRAELIHINDLRIWMDRFCNKVITLLNAGVNANV